MARASAVADPDPACADSETCLSLEHDPEKACPGLDPGWEPVSEKIMLKQKDKRRV
jgi:hypothetical protein